jgi:hypothetical protein
MAVRISVGMMVKKYWMKRFNFFGRVNRLARKYSKRTSRHIAARTEAADRKMRTFSPKEVRSKKEGFVIINNHSIKTYEKAANVDTIARLIGEIFGVGKILRMVFIKIAGY